MQVWVSHLAFQGIPCPVKTKVPVIGLFRRGLSRVKRHCELHGVPHLQMLAVIIFFLVFRAEDVGLHSQ